MAITHSEITSRNLSEFNNTDTQYEWYAYNQGVLKQIPEFSYLLTKYIRQYFFDNLKLRPEAIDKKLILRVDNIYENIVKTFANKLELISATIPDPKDNPINKTSLIANNHIFNTRIYDNNNINSLRFTNYISSVVSSPDKVDFLLTKVGKKPIIMCIDQSEYSLVTDQLNMYIIPKNISFINELSLDLTGFINRPTQLTECLTWISMNFIDVNLTFMIDLIDIDYKEFNALNEIDTNGYTETYVTSLVNKIKNMMDIILSAVDNNTKLVGIEFKNANFGKEGEVIIFDTSIIANADIVKGILGIIDNSRVQETVLWDKQSTTAILN